MNITNKFDLPKAFVEMARSDEELAENEYRVTSLLKGVRETILERRHAGEIEQDVSDMVWLLFGSAVHGILESQQEGETEFKETRIKQKVGDYVLSGKFDLYDADQKTITDYKTASVWKIIFGDFDDWKKQLMIYGWLLKKVGFEVEKGQIVAFLKDHSKREAKLKPDYPQLPVQKIEFSFSEKDFEEIENWINEKFAEIAYCEKLEDYELPVCSPEERYNSGDKFAVMKNGRKKALRVFETKEMAESYLEREGDYIVTRPGEDKKCADYCRANEFCNYWKGKQHEVDSAK